MTSIEDLNKTIEIDSIIGRLNWRLQKATLRLRKLKKEFYDDVYFPPMMKELGELYILESVLSDAISNEYPIVFHGDFIVYSLEELSKVADEILFRAENWTHKNW